MRKRQLKTFQASVDNNTESAEVICHTFLTNAENNKEFVGEFTVVWSDFRPTTDAPSDEEFSFQASLREHNNASAEAFLSTYPFGLEEWIQNKLKEAYGETCDVTVKPFFPPQ